MDEIKQIQKVETPAGVKVNTPAASAPASAPLNLPKDQGKGMKRFIYGCCSLFGCSLILFLALIFIFIGFGGTTENPIFALFGVSGPEVVNVIIAISNLIFGFLTFIIFIITVIGVFRFATTKKTDKENRKKAAMLTFGALGILFIMIFLWIFAVLFLRSKQTFAPSQAIITEPASTINLTAPITIKFDASKIPLNRKQFQILTYTWDFDDGEERTGNPVQTKTYEDKGRRDGRFDVKLTLSLREIATGKELSAEYPRIVTITNERARIDLDADPEKGEAPLNVKFDASKSVDPDGEIQSFEWEFNDDGKFDDASGETAEYTFEKIGSYKVSLRVTEADSSQVVEEKIIEVISSLAPQPVIEIEDVTGDTLYKGINYTFSGEASTAPAGNIKSYEWNFGDGAEKKVTRVATHIYNTPGSYEVTLKITDSTGRTGELAKRITVNLEPQAPTAKVNTNPEITSGKISGTVPVTVEFDASGSSDPDNDLVEFRWDFDGDSKVDSHDEKITYTYEEVGVYKTSLTLIDSMSKETKWEVTVEVKAPGLQARISANPEDGEAPLTVTFDASASSYPGNRIVAYEWNFGDGSQQRVDTAKISHQYAQIGTFTAKVSAVGNDNAKSEATVAIHVRSVSLNACFTASPEEGLAPLDVIFDPSCSAGTVARYKWTFGTLASSQERKPTFRFTQKGTYNVILEVTDSQSVTDTYTKQITVQ